VSNPWEATELFGKMLGEYTDNGYRMGTLDERERIIALLENYTMYRFEKEWVIALIKGENE
jgi:hypothetical protein